MHTKRGKERSACSLFSTCRYKVKQKRFSCSLVDLAAVVAVAVALILSPSDSCHSHPREENGILHQQGKLTFDMQIR